VDGRDFYGRKQKRVSGETSNARLIGMLLAQVQELTTRGKKSNVSRPNRTASN